MPEEYVRKGDPYEKHCIETTRLLRERLGIDEKKLMLTFQSRFGRAKWLEPATDETVKALAKRGVKSLAVVTPGFSADCLETLEEIAVENAHIFQQAWRREFRRATVSQRQRTGYADAGADGAARVEGLGLKLKK